MYTYIDTYIYIYIYIRIYVNDIISDIILTCPRISSNLTSMVDDHVGKAIFLVVNIAYSTFNSVVASL